MGERSNGESLWLEPEKSTDREMVRKMMGKALEIGVTAVMENNIYRCGGEIRIQGEGGAIGVKMTGDLAKAVMVRTFCCSCGHHHNLIVCDAHNGEQTDITLSAIIRPFHKIEP